MKKEERKSFGLSRFGYNFRVIINNTTTTVILDKGFYTSFIGTATVHAPDIYDRELGIKIAMRSAINKYHSYEAGQRVRKLSGFQSRMRNFTDKLADEIQNIRLIKKAFPVNTAITSDLSINPPIGVTVSAKLVNSTEYRVGWVVEYLQKNLFIIQVESGNKYVCEGTASPVKPL